METLNQLDHTLFWWINGHHNGFMDVLMWTLSQSWSWAVVLLFFLVWVVWRRDRQSMVWVLLGIALCFLLADQISSHVIKESVMRLRPCHEMEGVRMYHTRPGGLYGFVSSHAANVFSLAMFLSLCYGGRRKSFVADDGGTKGGWRRRPSGYRNPGIPYLLFLWAMLVAYSRPYLGKHFPGDIVCGALVGLGVGAVVYFILMKVRVRVILKEGVK